MPTVGGLWGCESRAAATPPLTKYVNVIETNQMGDIRVQITDKINTDLALHYIILQPSSTPNSYTPPTFGSAIASWTCGPQTGQTPDISKYLPGSCRSGVALQGAFAQSPS